MNRESQIALTEHPPLFAEARGDIAVSFEFFPPKTDAMAETLWKSIETLAPLHPRFVSVTYGAGGSTRERTHATVTRLVRETDLTPAAHLTCVGATRDEIDEIARSYWDAGRAPHRRASRRHARARRSLFGPSGGICQCGRAGRRPEGRRAVRGFGRRLSRGAPGFRLRRQRSRQSAPQDRRGRGPGDYPILLLGRQLLPLPRQGRRAAAGDRDRARHPASVERCDRPASSPASAARRFPNGWTGCSKVSTTCPPRGSWSPRPSPGNCAASFIAAGSAISISTRSTGPSSPTPSATCWG